MMVGVGGVGKTTSSIATALALAMGGKKVGLISIDPAKRLAAAVGIPLSGELSPIYDHILEDLGGSIDACMLDQQSVFDKMVDEYSSDRDQAKEIKENPLYKAASSKVSGVLEYMALAKLYDMLRSNDYHVIVVDTPPSSHTLDFLAKPNILADFYESQVMRRLIKPLQFVKKYGGIKIPGFSHRIFSSLTHIAGRESLLMLAGFIDLIDNVIYNFHDVGCSISERLQQTSTFWILCTTSQKATLEASHDLALRLNQVGYSLDLVVFNKCLPETVERNLASFFLQRSVNRPNGIGVLSQMYKRSQREKNAQREFMSQLKCCLTSTQFVSLPEHPNMSHEDSILTLAKELRKSLGIF